MKNMFEEDIERDNSLRDLIYFPVVFNVVGLLAIGLLYALSPRHPVETETLNTVLYLGVFITQWSLACVIIRRLGIRGVRELIVPKKELRWPPSILVFISLNTLFTVYMVLGLKYSCIPPWGKFNLPRLIFYLMLSPVTAGFVEELIWRGYFIEKLIATGKTKWRAIILSSISFAFIHGFLVLDKLAVTFLFGIIAGVYYVSERNLLVLMGSHVVLDVIAFGLPFFVHA